MYVRPAAARAVLARERAWRSDALRETNPGALDDGPVIRRRGAARVTIDPWLLASVLGR